MNIQEKLSLIQAGLVSTKNKENKFGGFNYRSCECILESLKPLLASNQCSVTLSDSLECIGDRFYIKATASIFNNDGESISTTALAREASNKKGMDEAQLTGSTSSYARKYALSGLFAIDSNEDSDALTAFGKTLEELRDELESMLENSDKYPDRKKGMTPGGNIIQKMNMNDVLRAISLLNKK